MRRHHFALAVAGILACSTTGLSADDPPAVKPKPETPAQTAKPAPLAELPWIDPDTIKPGPLTPIRVRDDPPPHEGAMIDIPYIIEPPDLLIVEVLEALPGRPITGERLVRPDGTINLGFYGDVHVRGLTVTQAKEKIVLHLRRFLDDAILGLVVPDDAVEPDAGKVPKPASRKLPQGDDDQAAAEVARRYSFVRPNTFAVPRLYSRRDGNPAHVPAAQRHPLDPQTDRARRVAPRDTDRVFLDVTAFNSKFYFVQGDVATPGKLPFTGQETVLDVLNYAGGFIPVSDQKNIHLYRPARGGKPAKVYAVDIDAIEHGETTLNYQLFPGDRLVIGRDPLVMATIQQDRLAAMFQTTVNSALQLSFMTRSFTQATPNLTPPQSEALLKEWFDLWWKAASKPGGPVPDEAAYRELLLKALQRPGSAGTTEKPEKK
jgi:protein involved in polysaccharide export with SLBB domain